MIRHVTTIRARYSETDQMKAVYYSRFFEYFEQARSDLLRSIGLPYPQLEEMGLLLPVIEAHASYKRPVRYDDLIQVVTYFREKPVARARLDYEIFREGESDLIADGYTIHSFVNAATGRPTRAPAQFLEAVEEGMTTKG
ncbi:MAG: acyl-CoA thioesterase [Bacteroidetes bacterium]|nr:acyl-CoA thioesterase [Bacteroidota bacterium]